MSPEEMIGSDDIEIAQLGVNIILSQYDMKEVLKLLAKRQKKFKYRRTETTLTLYEDFEFLSNHSFVKDPTRTVLIELDNEKS